MRLDRQHRNAPNSNPNPNPNLVQAARDTDPDPDPNLNPETLTLTLTRYADGRAQVGTWLADKPTDGAAWSEDRRTAWIVRDGQPTAEVSLSAAAAIAESFGLEVPSTRGNLHRAY